ncbi:putative Ig domain-containing protein, partial [bacterium]|nr:putative Ig domain-containing protein [bacterium]
MVIYSGTGEAIVGWEDSRDGPYYGWRSLRVQKFSAGPNWTPGGVRVSLPNNVSSQIVSYCDIVSDGAGGVIAFWTDERNGNRDIFAQRVNSSGEIQWTEGGITVCDAEDSQSNLQAVSDGSGGAVIVWVDRRSGGNRIYTQHIDGNGNILWDTNGILIGTGINPRIIRNSDGTYFILWTNDKILAQRIGDDGIGWWSEGGVEVYSSGVQNDYEVIDVDDGVVVVFSNNNIYAQKIYKNGTLSPSSSLTITTEKDLPQGALEEEYNLRIGAVGGNGNRYTWQIVEGNLPEGLSLNSTTGVISGIPAELGTFNFTISATDGISTAQQQFRLFIQIDTGMFGNNEYPAVAKGSSYLLVTRKSENVYTPSYIYCQFFHDNGYKDGEKLTVYENDWVDKLDVAYNPVNNKYLIVFMGGEYIPNNPDYKLYGIFVDGETHQASDAFVIMDENCKYPDVEVNPQNGNFLIVASEDKYGGKWKGIILNKEGQPQTEIFDIGEKSGWPYNCSIAFNPDNLEFLVSYTYGSSKKIWGRIVKSDGTLEDEKELASSSSYLANCKLTYNQKIKKYFIVYYTSYPYRVLGRIINSDGTPSGEPFYISKTELDEHYGNVATTSSGNTYAFWADRSDENGEYNIDSFYIYAQKIGENGSEFEEDYLLTPYTGLKYTPIAVKGNTDDNLLVLWKSKEGSSYKVYGVFYNPSSFQKGDINGDEKIDISD